MSQFPSPVPFGQSPAEPSPLQVGRVTAFDRPAVAAARLLELDPRSAFLALVAPNNLSPTQRMTIADKAAPENGVMKAVLSTATNPLFLLGAFLTMKFPVPLAQEVFKTAKNFSAYERKVNPLMRWLNPAWDNYRGTTVPQVLVHVADTIRDYTHHYMEDVAKAITKWEQVNRRKFDGSPENILVHAKLGGLDRTVTRDLKKVMTKRGRIVGIKRVPKTYDPLFKEIRLDPVTQEVHDTLRRSYDTQWRRITADPMRLARGIRAMRDGELRLGDPDRVFLEGLFDDKTLNALLRAKKISNKRLERVLKEYFEPDPAYHPRYRVGGQDAFEVRLALARQQGKNQMVAAQDVAAESLERELLKHGLGPKARRRIKAAAFNHTANPSLLTRQNTNLWDNYDPEALRKVRQYLVDPDLPERNLRRMAAVKAKAEATGRQVGTTPFTMNSQRAWEEYTNRLARTRALYVDDLPDWLVEMNNGLASKPKVPLAKGMAGGEALRAEYDSLASEALKRDLVDVWVPSAKGQLTTQQFNQRLFWSDIKRRFGEILDAGSPDPSKPGGLVGRTLQKALGAGRYEEFRMGMERVPQGQIGTGLAAWLYTGALGASPGAAFQNMFQSYLTTVQFVPFKHVVAGQVQALGALRKYAQLRMRGVASHNAAQEAFPLLVEIGQELNPMFTRGLAVSLEGSYQQGIATVAGVKSKAEKLQGVLMSMFSNSERFVRLTAAYGARDFALASGMGGSAVTDFVNQVVQRTQFAAGVANTPRAFVNLPAPLRQFATFPTRLLTTVTSTSPYVGGGQPRFFSGGLGRALVGSTAIFEAGRALLDVDVDRMLFFGGLPLPEPDGPLAPLPIVPPLVGAVASGVSALAGGDTTELRYAVTPFIPGGVSLAKIAPLAMPGVAEKLGLPYVDWENPVGGMYPYFSQTGALVGYFTKEQLALKAAGIDQTGTQREGAVLHYLTKQRDEIRMLRRKYAESLWSGEFDQAHRIEAQWRQNFPELGPITVQKQDYQNLQTRLTVTRLERAIQTLPPDVRGVFSAAISAGLSPRFQQMFGIEAGLLGEESRVRNRARQMGPVTQQRGLYGLGGEGGYTQSNQQPMAPAAPFTGFQGFRSPIEEQEVPLY